MPKGLNDVRLDLLSTGASCPPRCVLCDRFRVGRLSFEGLTSSPRESAVPGVEAIDAVEYRGYHCPEVTMC